MENEIKQQIEKQRLFFKTGFTQKVQNRINVLKELKKCILKYEKKLSLALFHDLHKSEFESYATEIGFVLEEIGYLIKNLKHWAKPQKVETPFVHFKAESNIYSEPYGHVLVIAPWNYPFQLTFAPLAGAIAAGNVVTVKPSEFSPETTSVMNLIINEVFNNEYVNVFVGDKSVSEILLKQKFDLIFFTGSTHVGRIVMKAAAEFLTPVVLELGGKSPCIVAEDAALDYAAKRIAWGKFLNAGQTCVAPDYVLVHESVENVFLQKIKENIQEFYTYKAQNSPDYPRIINKQNFLRLVKLLEGTEIFYGGKCLEEELFIEPTILRNVTPNAAVMQQEIFGPILPVITYNELDKAIEFINNGDKPLALYLFTGSKATENKIIENVSFGGGCINETVMHLANNNLPFGGVGASGMGAYHGKYSFDAFSHKKAVMKKTNFFDVPLRYPPYNDLNLNLLKKVMK